MGPAHSIGRMQMIPCLKSALPVARVAQTAESMFVDPLCLDHFGTLGKMIDTILSDTDSHEAIERVMLEAEQMDCPVIHRFGPGIYIREIIMPAGAFAIGAYHKGEHLNIMLKGRVSVLGEAGKVIELKAPMIFVGKPGKKIGYVHEEVVWQNVYATDETDIETLERMFVDKGPAWLEANERRKANQESILHTLDRMDYDNVLKEFGYTREQAEHEVSYAGDRINFPHGSYKVMVSDSSIHGRGLFATADIEPGEFIAPARIGGKRTPAVRYTNHSFAPNSKFVLRQNGDIDLVAERGIKGMKGGMPGDEITICYREALKLRELSCQLQSLPQ